MFILELEYTAGLDAIDERLPDHSDWLDLHYAAGTFLASGRKEPRTGGVIIAAGDDRAAIDALVATDPFSVAGVCRYEITQFYASRTCPALDGYLQQLP